jgi:hypothetical protein
VFFLDFECSLDVQFGRYMSEKKEKNPHAVHLGQLGGNARTGRLTPERRREIARKAALARWAKKRKKTP